MKCEIMKQVEGFDNLLFLEQRPKYQKFTKNLCNQTKLFKGSKSVKFPHIDCNAVHAQGNSSEFRRGSKCKHR